jgi:hypothetical protein
MSRWGCAGGYRCEKPNCSCDCHNYVEVNGKWVHKDLAAIRGEGESND